MKFRHELKHIINYGDFIILKTRLDKIFRRDKYINAHGFYRVRSLYLDDVFNTALRDKVDGVDKREKYRFRLYNGNTSFIKLEKKLKINNLCNKTSIEVSKEEVEKILLGEYEFLLDRNEKLAIELYSKIRGGLLRPMAIVEYKRYPYVFLPGNVRITLDVEIKTALKSLSFLDENLNLLPAENDIYGVLEVKYDEFLPEIVKKSVQIGNRPASAFSKYAISRRFD